MTKKTVYRISPFGIGIHLHLNEPDAKFNPDNPMFKGKLKLEGEPAVKLKADIDAAVEEAFTDYFENGDGASLKPAEKAKYSRYYPYEAETDDDGNETGAILFDFKQNAKIRLKDGTIKTIQMPIYDSADNPVHKLVRTGSVIRFAYAIRPIPMKSLKQIGVRLDFAKVQVKELREGGSSGGFGAVEGGYVEDTEESGFGAGTSGSTGGDY